MAAVKPRELVPNCVLSRRVSFSSFPAVIGKKRKRSLHGIQLVKKAPRISLSQDVFTDINRTINSFHKTASLVLSRLDHDPSSKSKVLSSSYSSEFNQSQIIKGIESRDMKCFALAVLAISTLLGYLTKIGAEETSRYTYGKDFHKLSLFWGTTIESLIVYTKKELMQLQNSSTTVIDFSEFVLAENEEIYFSSLSKILRSGGHKLKSKLKPENIGLLVPGEFLPNHPRELKDGVGLQIAEKSNHLYTWKSAGEQVTSRRKRSSWSSIMSRNIRPRNRCNFPSEEVFYSAWDTTFYTVKCEEVLENEYYNQLENSLNNHTKRKQLSLKKIEINKKKKANDTKDSFYFDAFLNRSISSHNASDRIEILRDKALSLYWQRTRTRGSNNDAPVDSKKTPVESLGSTSASATGQESNTATRLVSETTSSTSVNLKKESSIQIKAEKNPNMVNLKIKVEDIRDAAYDNDVLGLVARPHTVLETETDLVKYVHSRAVNLSKIQQQFVSEVNSVKATPVLKNKLTRTKQSLVTIPGVMETCLGDIENHSVQALGSPCIPTTITEAVSLILEELVYKVCCLVFNSVAASDGASTSSEDTTDEFYSNIHSEYLNVGLAVSLNNVSGNVVMSPKMVAQRRKRY